MSNTHIPERTCIICRAKNEKSKLFRLAKVKEAFYEFDKEQKTIKEQYMFVNHLIV